MSASGPCRAEWYKNTAQLSTPSESTLRASLDRCLAVREFVTFEASHSSLDVGNWQCSAALCGRCCAQQSAVRGLRVDGLCSDFEGVCAVLVPNMVSL